MLFTRIVTMLAGALVSAVVLRWKDEKTNEAPWRAELDALHKNLIKHLDTRDGELAARIAEFQPRIEALAREFVIPPDGRIDELATRIAQLQPKIEALAASIAKPDPRIDNLSTRLAAVESRPMPSVEVSKPDPRVEAIAVRLTAVESKASTTETKIGELEHKVSEQDLRLQATNRVVVAVEQLLTSKIAEFDHRIESQARTLQAMNSSIAQSDELLERVLDLVQNLSPAVAEPREPVAVPSANAETRELHF